MSSQDTPSSTTLPSTTPVQPITSPTTQPTPPASAPAVSSTAPSEIPPSTSSQQATSAIPTRRLDNTPPASLSAPANTTAFSTEIPVSELPQELQTQTTSSQPPQPQVSSSNPPPPAAPTPFSSMKKKLLPILIVVIVLIIVGIAAMLLLRVKKQSVSPNSPSITPKPTQSVVSLPTQSITGMPTSSTSAFVKRLFDPNQMDNGLKVYPDQLTRVLLAVSNDNLVGLRCSQIYAPGTNIYYDNQKKASTNIQLQQQGIPDNVNQFIKTESQQLGYYYDGTKIMYCDAEDGKTIISYETPKDPKKTFDRTAFIGLLQSNGTIDQLVQFPGATYFGCEKFLQLSRDGILYYQCGAGEADHGYTDSYQLDIAKKINTRILHCTEQFGVISGPPQITCK